MAKSKNRRSDTASILPSQLKVGDRYDDAEGEWEVVGHPFTTGGGKTVHARVQRPGNPASARQDTWAAHQRITVRRAGEQHRSSHQ